MPRPNKTGLDYFPLDVDIFEDEKISAISGEFGIKGEITVIKLLCAIYRNGYFILWNDLLKFKLLRSLPEISSELIESIVNRLVLWEFFDKNLFDSVKVLTSRGIQRRYFEAVKRRKAEEELPYLLVNVCNNTVNVRINTFSDDINASKNPTKESKVKESKENKEKTQKKADGAAFPSEHATYDPVKPQGGDAATEERKSFAQKKESATRFKPPAVEEVAAYCRERGNNVDAQSWWDFYQSKGWMVGSNKMKDWKAAVRTWEQRHKNETKINGNGNYIKNEFLQYGNTKPEDFKGKGHSTI